MTITELQNEICALGFSNYREPDVGFIFSVRRALNRIYTEMRIINQADIHVTPRAPHTRVAKLHHTGGGVETLPLIGKAYSMSISGKGSIAIKDGDSTLRILFSSPGGHQKGFLRFGGEVVFEGEQSYDVYDIVTFEEAFFDEVEDIPDGGGIQSIDFRKLHSDFLSFETPPTDDSGTPITEAVLGDGIIYLPAEYCGRIHLTYRRLPTSPSLLYPDRHLDIPKKYEPLLALLTAYYVLLDDDTETAYEYKRAYDELSELLRPTANRLVSGGYRDVTGW